MLLFFVLQFDANLFQLRTRETHTHHCKFLNSSLYSHAATTYGVVKDSILNNLQYFHVVEGLVPDVMHDVLEGSAQMEVKELMKYLISNGNLTLKEINSQIQYFPYSTSDVRNRPSTISQTTLNSSDHSLKQKGKCNINPLEYIPGVYKQHMFMCIDIVLYNFCSCSNVVPMSTFTTDDWMQSY